MAKRRRSSHRFARVSAALGLTIWVLLPIVLVAGLTVLAVRAPSHPQENVLVTPEANTTDISRPVALDLRWQPGSELIAPAWSGVVQEVLVSPGTMLASGTPFVRIDGVLRVVAAVDQPFYRALAIGTSGRDVANLNEFLRGLGHPAPESDRFTQRTLGALQAFAASIGVPDSRQIASFDPGWVIFAPGGSSVEEVTLRVGAPVPAAGEAVGTLTPTLIAAALVSAPSSTTTSSDEDEESTSDEPLIPTEVAAADEVLTVEGHAIELGEDRQLVTGVALVALQGVVTPSAASTTGLLSLPVADDQWLVPAAAVILDATGSSCIHVVRDGDTVPIDVLSQAISNRGVAIVADLNTSSRIVIYPAGEPASCS